MVRIDVTPYIRLNKVVNAETLAIEIYKNRDQQIVLDLNDEAYDIVETGMEDCVKRIADVANIPYNQIKFSSSDFLAKSSIFEHRTDLSNAYQSFRKNFICEKPSIILPQNNGYGLFIGRGNNERLYTFWKHLNWQYTRLGTATLHEDPHSKNLLDTDYLDFIISHTDKWHDIENCIPYTDTGHVITGTGDNTYDVESRETETEWQRIYKNVSIEIVCETVANPDVFFITEKILRPIRYGRLFLVVASPEYEKNLKQMGFDIFEDIIDKGYDVFSSYSRVDAVYKSLEKFLINPIRFESLLPRLQANQQRWLNIRDDFDTYGGPPPYE